MQSDDPIGRKRGDRFVNSIAIISVVGSAWLVVIAVYAVWTGLFF